MIALQDVHKQFGEKVLLNSVTESLETSARIGVIGVNGAGKSVLLRMIAGKEEPNSGRIAVPSDYQIAYLPQEMDVDSKDTVMSHVLEPFKDLLQTEHLYKTLSEHREGSKEYQRISTILDRVQKKQAIYDIFGLQARAKSFLAGLGVPEKSWSESIELLSGGFRMRVILARLLLKQPDFLLLDEPTNHLDMDSLIWLESFLSQFDGGMAIVSHDRAFLDRVTDTTAELVNGSLTIRKLPVSAYFEWKDEYNLQVRKQIDSVTDKIARAEKFVERFKAKATKASQARSKQKQIDKLKEQISSPAIESNHAMHFTLPPSGRTARVPFSFENVTLGYCNAPSVLQNVNVTINRGDKVAIVGPNGAGKSTFLKACAGMLEPTRGSVVVGQNCAVRYFSQHRLDQLDVNASVYDTIVKLAPEAGRTYIQSILGAFLFSGEDVNKRVEVLSGGEKARLSLAAILADPGNVLLLDEPTNHLDIQSVQRLADVLHDFDGTVVIVSHDEAFISKTATRIIEIRPHAFRDFPGTLAQYRSYIEEGILKDLEPTSKVDRFDSERGVNHEKENRIVFRKRRKQLERQIEKIENSIDMSESTIRELKGELHNPSHAHNFQKLQELNEQIAHNESQHCDLMAKWEELQIQLEEVVEQE